MVLTRETEALYAARIGVGVATGAANILCSQVKKLPTLARALGRFVDVLVSLACFGLTAGPYADFLTNIGQAHDNHNCLTLEAGLPPLSRLGDFDDGRGPFCKP